MAYGRRAAQARPHRTAMPRLLCLAAAVAAFPSRLRLGVLPLVSAETGLCEIGECINCMYCNGDCYENCKCYSDINTCCCKTPPGYYSRGYAKVPCPGGTYQDRVGMGRCKPCNTTDALYDLNARGSLDLLDCENSICQAGENCVTSSQVTDAMHALPLDAAFCSNMTTPIANLDCSWIPASGARRCHSWPYVLLLPVFAAVASSAWLNDDLVSCFGRRALGFL